MASHKYLGDYRLENIEKNGKLKTVAVYRGKYYAFVDPNALSRERTKLLVCGGGFWLAQLVGLTLPSDWGHIVFVIMPMVFAMLPFWFVSMGLYTAYFAKHPLRREQAEKVQPRFAGGSLMAATLSGASFTGSFVAYFTHIRIHPVNDVIFSLCAAAQTSAAIICFMSRSRFKTEVVGSAEDQNGQVS